MRALVVDDEETLRLTVRGALEAQNYTVDEAEDGQQAIDKVLETYYDVIILDVNMPNMNGLDALQKIKQHSPKTLCLVATAYSDLKDAVAAIKYGAYDYLEKPLNATHLIKILESAGEANAMVEAAAFSAPQLHFDENRKMIGGSSEIQKVFEVIHKLSKVETSVLIRGESGTGKELVARAIHFNSHRKKGPFVAVNCAAIPENLIESELFGHEKGSFTGADKRKIGKFQFAEGGTLFLDEIGDISQNMQVKLLRVLQEKMYTLVGSNQELKADVRIVAATNRPLEDMIEKGTFRADLFYRLNILPIMLPPLRERRDDILPLINFMIKKFNKIHNRSIKKFDNDALMAARLYNWPGNIRELENVVEHAFILESTDVVSVSALPSRLLENLELNPQPVAAATTTVSNASVNSNEEDEESDTDIKPSFLGDMPELNFPALKEQFERDFLIKALKTFNGRINQTALHTKMTKVTLLRKLDRYGINPKEYHRH